MWCLDVQVLQAPQPDWSAQHTSYHLTSSPVTIGRPAKGQAASPVDIVVHGDSAVSKVHAQLEWSGDKMTIQDLGRYGTFVNGDKMAPESVQQLKEGDALKLAAKVHMRLRQVPMRLCLSGGFSEHKQAALEHAAALGVEVVERWQEGITHVLAADGQHACSLLGRALLTRVPIATLHWLSKLREQKHWPELPPLEGSCRPEALTLPGATAGVRRPLAACFGGRDPDRTMLKAFIVHFVNNFQDDNLAFCLKYLGAYLPGTPAALSPAAGNGNTLAVSDDVQFVHREALPQGQAALLPHMPAPELLACLLAADVSTIQQRLINASLVAEAEAKAAAQAAAARKHQPPTAAATAAAAHDDQDDLTEEEDVEALPGMGTATAAADVAPTLRLDEENQRGAAAAMAAGDRAQQQRLQPRDSNLGAGPAMRGEVSNAGKNKQQRQGDAAWVSHGGGPAGRTRQAAAEPPRAAPSAAAEGKQKQAAGGGKKAAVATGETVGPGHPVLYLPLVITPEPEQGEGDSGAGAAHGARRGPNFKCFRKVRSDGLGGAGRFPALPQQQQQVQPVPMMLVEGTATEEAMKVEVARLAEQHARKRKADDLFVEAAKKATGKKTRKK